MSYKKAKNGAGPCDLTQTSRHRDSVEYRNEVFDAPYYTSFPKGDGSSEKQPAGEDGTWVK